jgi:hypothetical protein
MLISYRRGQTGVVLRIKILDSTVASGAGKTGLTGASSGLVIATIGDNEAVATAYTAAGGTIETIGTLGTYAAPSATKCRFREVDATNHKGIYEIQFADARYAIVGAKSLLISVSGASGAAETDAVIPLLDIDPYDAVRAGLTALPNAAANAIGGLPTRGGAIPDATAGASGGLLVVGTGSGAVNPSGGKVPATLAAGDVTGNLPATVNAMATDVITAAALAASAVTEIQSGLSTLDVAAIRTALGLASANLDTQLAALLARLPDVVISGTVFGSGTTTGFAAAAGLTTTDDFYNGSVVAFTSGSLKGLARRVTDYTGSTRTFTFAVALPSAPQASDTFIILGRIDSTS